MHYSPELARDIAKRHGLPEDVRLMPNSGMVNEAWMLGDEFVLRIIAEEGCDDEAAREVAVVPLVVAAGIRTTELVAHDLSCQLAPKPYTVYRRAAGELLGHIDQDPAEFEPLYREVGREIALLHRIEPSDELKKLLRRNHDYKTEEDVVKAREKGAISADEEADLRACLERLRGEFGPPPENCLMHADIHPWNVFADPAARDLTAIIDWGDAKHGDPAVEFASMPMLAMRGMFSGYAEAGGRINSALVARSLYIGIWLMLWELEELEESRFDRRWWRTPPGGLTEAVRRVDSILGEFTAVA